MTGTTTRATEGLKSPSMPRASLMERYGGAVVFAGSALLFAMAAWLMGLPGPDGNAIGTYDGIGRLAHSFTYAISRTPGQPFLDYCNFVFWSLGGDLAVQAWFVLVSALGVTALYHLLRDIQGASPLVGACALALHPLFLGHVGGVGDFAVSLSFLLIALWAGARGRVVAAGLALGMAVGCRLNLCIYVVSVVVLIWAARRKSGDSSRVAFTKAAYTGLLAGGVSLLQFAPLFSFYGWALLRNFQWQNLRYHASASAYRLLVGFGAAFWVVAVALLVWRFARRGRASSAKGPGAIGLAAAWLILGTLATLFRVPGKAEYALPFLAGTILLFQAYAPKGWSYALLIGSVAAGLVIPSPYDNERGVYGWRFATGWYAQLARQARDSRLQIGTLRAFLASSPPRTVLVARCAWTQDQARKADVRAVRDYQGIAGLTGVYAFTGLGGDRVVVHFQEPKLRQLLEQVNTGAGGQSISVVYDRTFTALMRRWNHLDLAQYGRAVDLPSEPFQELWRHGGQSNTEVVEGANGR